MPRDFDNYRPAYPKGYDQYIFNPWKKELENKKKKVKKFDESEVRTARKMHKPGDKSFTGDKSGWFLE